MRAYTEYEYSNTHDMRTSSAAVHMIRVQAEQIRRMTVDEYIRELSSSKILYDRFVDQLLRTVVYKEHTDCYYSALGSSGEYPILHYSGLTAFIPLTDNAYLQDDYENTEWYRTVCSQ